MSFRTRVRHQKKINFNSLHYKMKPVKKTDQGVKKKEKISNFFQSDSKHTLNEFENTKPIYVNRLKKTLEHRDVVGKENSHKNAEVLATEQQASNAATEQQASNADVLDNEDLFDIDNGDIVNDSPKCKDCLEKDKKYSALMKVYLKLTHRYTQLEQKYDDLRQLKNRTNQPEPDGMHGASIGDDVFTPNEVKYLQAMPLGKSTDSTFILKCLEYAYKFDLTVLRLKTLKGKSESVQYNDDGDVEQQVKKDPLTPIKVERIKELFVDRLTKCKIDSVAFGERIKDANVNKLFATGILNIVKKIK